MKVLLIASILLLLMISGCLESKSKLKEEYQVGKETCSQNECITPLYITTDRYTARFVVYDINLNRSCLQDLNDGILVNEPFFNCYTGHGSPDNNQYYTTQNLVLPGYTK